MNKILSVIQGQILTVTLSVLLIGATASYRSYAMPRPILLGAAFDISSKIPPQFDSSGKQRPRHIIKTEVDSQMECIRFADCLAEHLDDCTPLAHGRSFRLASLRQTIAHWKKMAEKNEDSVQIQVKLHYLNDDVISSSFETEEELKDFEYGLQSVIRPLANAKHLCSQESLTPTKRH